MRLLAHTARIAALLLLVLSVSACGFGNQRAQDNAELTRGVEIERIVTAEGIGQGNAPVQETSTFDASQDYIYVVAEVARLDAGTTMFARWSRDGQPLEDSQPVSADRDYQDTYVEFHLENLEDRMEPGDYSVQLFVNGNPAEAVDFRVQ